MGIIHINKLKEGMVLDDEVRDINGRLLLKKNKTIQSSHIRIFKIWGITEVNIQGSNGNKEAPTKEDDPEAIEIIRKKTIDLFRHVDLEHPAVKEIFEISVHFRSKYNLSETEKMIHLADVDTEQKANGKDFLKKLSKENMQ